MNDHAVQNDHLLIKTRTFNDIIESWESSREDDKKIPIFKKLKIFLLHQAILDLKNLTVARSSRLRLAINDTKSKRVGRISSID